MLDWQGDQIGLFLNGLGSTFSFKCGQNFGQLFGTIMKNDTI